MKLATYQDGSRDGQLIVVSRDLSQAHYASHIANRLQQVLDDWNFLSPQLQDLSDALNAGKARHAFAFDPRYCMAPLPRAYQCVSANAYASAQNLLPDAGEPALACDPRRERSMVQVASDFLLGACDPMVCVSETLGLDFGGGVAVVTGDLPAGCSPERALEGVRLVMLLNEARLQTLGSIVACAFSPVAVTPDELGDAWAKGKLNLPLQCSWNGRKVGLCDAGSGMQSSFGRLLANLCETRDIRAGSIIATGPVGSKGEERKGRTEWPQGYCCIADKRAMETLQDGQPSTDYLRFGDSIRLEMKRPDGGSVFGAIEQDVAAVATAQR